MKATVLIPAAGTGRRMGTGISKQYLNLAGMPILAHTLRLFDNHPLIEHIYPIIALEEIPYCQQQIIERYGIRKVVRLVPGGAARQDSVRNGLLAVAEDGHAQPQRPILIHDGARPLFDVGLLHELLEIVRERGACIVGVPVKDTIKTVVAGRIDASPDRQRLWQAQTPQGFQYRLIRDASDRAVADQFAATDDASLLERIGGTIEVLEGDYRNIKVTTPEDLIIATALLDSMREESA